MSFSYLLVLAHFGHQPVERALGPIPMQVLALLTVSRSWMGFLFSRRATVRRLLVISIRQQLIRLTLRPHNPSLMPYGDQCRWAMVSFYFADPTRSRFGVRR